jgi:hypothetical protein
LPSLAERREFCANINQTANNVLRGLEVSLSFLMRRCKGDHSDATHHNHTDHNPNEQDARQLYGISHDDGLRFCGIGVDITARSNQLKKQEPLWNRKKKKKKKKKKKV